MILIENDVNTNPFTPAVHACVPPLPWAGVGPAELSDPNRADLRHLAVCSVDPPGCKDIDDALHVRQLPNGNYEVWRAERLTRGGRGRTGGSRGRCWRRSALVRGDSRVTAMRQGR